MSKLSYWEKMSLAAATEVMIIGAGITGLQCAIRLKELQPTIDLIVVDQNPFPSGASTRNAGFACIGSMTELIDDLTHLPEKTVWDVVAKRWTGLQKLKDMLGEQVLDFRTSGGYELFMEQDDQAYTQCLDQIDYFNQYMRDITGESQVFTVRDKYRSDYGFAGVSHIIENKVEGQLNPGKMMMALLGRAQSLGIRTMFGCRITGWEREAQQWNVYTDYGWNIRTRILALATNGFTRRLLPELEVKPARNQVLVSRQVDGLSWEGTFHYDRGYVYFRNIDGRLLIGGARHIAFEEEETDEYGENPVIIHYLKSLSEKHLFPGKKLEWEYSWSGILGTGSKHPIMEWIEPDLLVAVRLGGMGVAIGTQLGWDSAGLILERLS